MCCTPFTFKNRVISQAASAILYISWSMSKSLRPIHKETITTISSISSARLASHAGLRETYISALLDCSNVSVSILTLFPHCKVCKSPQGCPPPSLAFKCTHHIRSEKSNVLKFTWKCRRQLCFFMILHSCVLNLQHTWHVYVCCLGYAPKTHFPWELQFIDPATFSLEQAHYVNQIAWQHLSLGDAWLATCDSWLLSTPTWLSMLLPSWAQVLLSAQRRLQSVQPQSPACQALLW